MRDEKSTTTRPAVISAEFGSGSSLTKLKKLPDRKCTNRPCGGEFGVRFSKMYLDFSGIGASEWSCIAKCPAQWDWADGVTGALDFYLFISSR
jgi:hypothetical protein